MDAVEKGRVEFAKVNKCCAFYFCADCAYRSACLLITFLINNDIPEREEIEAIE